MTIFAPIVIACLGLIIGSFFNAFVWRFFRGISIAEKHSRCVHCRHVLMPLDLIPVFSYVALLGHCRYCQKAIPWQYPIVEFGTVGLSLLFYFTIGLHWSLAVFLLLGYLLELLFLLDFYYQILPDQITLPTLVVAIVAGALLHHTWVAIIGGTALGALFFFLQYAVSRGRWVGSGDIRLGAVMGSALGPGMLLLALLFAYVSGAVVALLLLATKRKTMQSHLPFGVFLTTATIVVFLWGAPILDFLQQLTLLPQ